MMKEYKQVNQQSNKQSTVYYTKHYNKRKPSKNTFEESLGMEDSGSSSLKMSTFKKLKNDIMQVKNQVKQLK